MRGLDLGLAIPDDLVADFGSDPLSQNEKILMCADDDSWPLVGTLRRFLEELPQAAVDLSFADETFIGIYGRSDRLARIWFAQQLLTDEVSRRRLLCLSEPPQQATGLPYIRTHSLDFDIDSECMVRFSDFEYNGSTLTIKGFSFVTCLVNQNFNSTYWLQQAFHQESLSDHVRVRLDPYLWGESKSFPQMMYRMLVFARPLNWKGIEQLREPHFGKMQADKPWHKISVTEFCWTPRDDGIHFVCEELPRKDLTDVQAARYLHAIYDPNDGKIVHFDGALRIYTHAEMDVRLGQHVRHAGKSGIRTKIFRTDVPISRESFSLVAQAFFIWNEDLRTYFQETLSAAT